MNCTAMRFSANMQCVARACHVLQRKHVYLARAVLSTCCHFKPCRRHKLLLRFLCSSGPMQNSALGASGYPCGHHDFFCLFDVGSFDCVVFQ